MKTLANAFMFLGKIFTKTKYPLVYFLFFYSAILFCGLYFDVVSTACFAILFYLCISISFLNHKRQQQKRQIIEGFINEEHATLIHATNNMNELFLFFVQLALLWTLTLLLREMSLQGNFFQPETISLSDWAIYSLDLILKAVLFDIPEIYKFNLIEIEHVGFWGSSAVFITRIIILVLVVGSLLNRYELRKTLKNAVIMLDKHPATAETRILMILKMYPNLFPVLKKYAYQKWSSNTLKNLLIVLGKHKDPSVITILETYFRNSTDYDIADGSLKGMEYLGQGNTKIIEEFFARVKKGNDNGTLEISLKFPDLQQQCCATLASWNTEESISLLERQTSVDEHDYIRENAISCLGKVNPTYSSACLVNIMLSEHYNKSNRFCAKKSLVEHQYLPPQQFSIVVDNLQNATKESNRRFAAMVLGAIPNLDGFSVLLNSFQKDQDDDTRAYCMKGIHYFAQLAYKDDSFWNKEMWKNIYPVIEKAILEDTYDIVQVEAVTSLKYIIRLREKGLEIPMTICATLDAALRSDRLRIADTTQNVLQHFYDTLAWKSWSLEPEFVKKWDALFDTFRSHHVEASVCQFDSPFTSDDPFAMGIHAVAKNDNYQGDILYGKYIYQKELSFGKHHSVIVVSDSKNKEQQVLKRLVHDNPQLQQNFEKEMHLLENLEHKNIITLIEKGDDYFTMPYMENNLKEQIQMSKENQNLCPYEDFLRIINGICQGLGYLHKQQIFHCDIKPGNIYYQHENIIIGDLGSARKLGDDAKGMMGTPPYMAPEQIYHENISERTDIYAVGILAYVILSGLEYSGIAKSLSEIRPDIPKEIDNILVKATSFQAKNRFSSIEEFWESLPKSGI